MAANLIDGLTLKSFYGSLRTTSPGLATSRQIVVAFEDNDGATELTIRGVTLEEALRIARVAIAIAQGDEDLGVDAASREATIDAPVGSPLRGEGANQELVAMVKQPDPATSQEKKPRARKDKPVASVGPTLEKQLEASVIEQPGPLVVAIGRSGATYEAKATEAAPQTEANTNGSGKPAGWDLAGDGLGDDEEDRPVDVSKGALPGDLSGLNRITQIVEWLRGHGYSSDESVIAACLAMRDRHPRLQRVRSESELKDQIVATLATLG